MAGVKQETRNDGAQTNTTLHQNKRGMYTMNKLAFGKNDLQRKYEDILGPLSLFAPFYHEEVQEKQELEVERPVTPIDEGIKYPPKTFKELAKLIRRRIAANPDTPHITLHDQQTLAGVIMGEVNCIWPDIRRQVDDPFLTADENKELQRRITVHIVTVCQQVFHHYVEKAQILNQRGVFSGPANMSRLKAQLSIDTNKFLNVLAIRRYIVADIRGNESESEEDFPMDDLDNEGFMPLSYQKLIETSRPKRKKRYRQNVELEVRDMNRQMPQAIQASRVLDLLPDVQMMQRGLFLDDVPPEVAPSVVESQGETRETIRLTRKLAEVQRPTFRAHRSDSLPELHFESLFDEMGIDEPPTRAQSSYQMRSGKTEKPTQEVQTARTTTQPVVKKVQIQEDVQRPDTREYLKRDLQKLSSFRSAKDDMEEPLAEEEDLPPLLQAVGETTRADARREELKKHIKAMEEKRSKEEEEEEIVKISEPTHPQPATITKKLPNKSVVRTSDIRVSERVSLSSVTLKLNKTVFNELIDDVDANTIKKMDSNLFRGQEINEVYMEIMKTLPTSHMEFDQDPFVEPPAKASALKHINPMASALHAKKGVEFILNKELLKTEDAPWGEKDRLEWCKSPIFNATFAKNRGGLLKPNDTQNLLDNTSSFNLGMSNFNLGLEAPSMPRTNMVDERNARSYQSWLNWWKSTISSQDYTKYMFTQDSDYLNAVFHMYEASNEGVEGDKDDKNALSQSKLAKQREKDQQLSELRAQKTEFTEGMWNVNSVLLGGLGKDPDLPEEETEEDETDTPRDTPSRLRKPGSRSGGSRSSMSASSVSPSRGDRSRNRLVPSSSSALKGSSRSSSRLSASTVRTKSRPGTSASAAPLTPQDRLEKVWTELQMPDGLKLDMAIKYSSDEYMSKLEESIEAWEDATIEIIEREAILAGLEDFERFASDPDRFWRKGPKGSSVNRLEEAKHRSQIYASLHDVDGRVRRKVQLVVKRFNDIITYQGRPYLAKMKVDCTEMLYWLQQERRQQALERHSLSEGVKLPVAELPPIQPLALY